MLKFVVVLACFLAVQANPLSHKVSPALEKSLKTKGAIDVFVKLDSPLPLINQLKNAKYASIGERKTVVSNTLKSFSAESQKSLLEFLAQSEVNAKSFWIANEVYIKNADAELIQKLALRSDVLGFREENKHKLSVETDARPAVHKQGELTWGLQKIGVEALWEKGINGTGVRAGMMDTGVFLAHEALRESYVNDKYGWFAPMEQTEEPMDDGGHGTHVMGTILGQGGIGVAPGAKWMACRNIPGGEAEDLACGQFFACPTHYDGSNPDCTKAPDFVSNSWGYSAGNDFFESTYAAWEAANIVPIFAAGNEGPGCSSLRSPGDSAHPALVTVGATDVNDDLSYFSSFGPSEFNVIKPDVSAPGSDILSSCYDAEDSYCEKSGTSMATPHVAGVVALIRGVEPTISVADVKKRLQNGATNSISSTDQSCGGIEESTYPNNHVGYGLLQAAS